MKKRLILRVGAAFTLGAMWLGFSGCAPVTLSSDPSGASVYYKGTEERIGETPIKVNMVASGKELVVRKNGYFSKTIALSPIDPQSVNVKLRRRDRVLIVSEPDGVELFVNGERVGRTPFRVDYTKSYREVVAKAPGYLTQTVAIVEDPEGDIMVRMERQGGVLVTSNPLKCEVYTADGHFLGATPVAVPAEGAVALEIRKEGYYSRTVTVDKDTASPLSVELEREPFVIIYSEPVGALVEHRGVTLGKTPFRQLVKRDMELEIVAERYYGREITVGPGSPREVRVRLDSKPYVTIESDPVDAVLYRSGGVERLGATPLEVLVEKDTAFEMHKEGYDIKPFVLSPQSSRQVTVPMKKTIGAIAKTVVIDSDPSGAKVYRPGGAEFIGVTPLEQHVRGERTFELQLEGFKTKIVTVAPDSADSVVFAMSPDQPRGNVTVSDPLLNTPSAF